VGEGKNQSCQGSVRIISRLSKFVFFQQSQFFRCEITNGICKSHQIQVGKGLSKDEKAQKLALQHWLEAVSIRYIAVS
jgi:hypothetical protein